MTGDGQPVKSNPGKGNASEKVLAVLEALPEHERVTEIAEVTGLPKSTVHRILRVLVDRQFALNVGGGRYLGGPRILSLSSKVMGRFEPAYYAEAALRKLQQSTGCTVHLGLLVGDDVVYAAKVEGSRPYHMPSRLGMSVRLHTTAVGKVALAWMDEAEVREIVQRTGLEKRTSNTLTSLSALLRDLRVVRERGYALDEEENEDGILCIGAPIFDHSGRVVGGVSISTITLEPWHRPVEDLADEVKKVGEEISRSFGASAVVDH